MSSLKILCIPFWMLPLFSGLAWLTSLLSLLAVWIRKGSIHYPYMQESQHLPYISDIATTSWGKPLFVLGSFITIMSFSIAFGLERWLRHTGRLPFIKSAYTMSLSATASAFTVVGTVCSILLTVFDIRDYWYAHYALVFLFISCYMFSALLMCAEKLYLRRCFPDNRALSFSFQIKAIFIIVEFVLALIFATTSYSVSVIVEWVIALLFVFFIWSLTIDFTSGRAFEKVKNGCDSSDSAWIEETIVMAPEKCI